MVLRYGAGGQGDVGLGADHGTVQMILQVPYSDIEKGLSEEQLRQLKKTGVLIIKGGVPKEVCARCC